MRFSYFALQASTLIAASLLMDHTAIADDSRTDLKALQHQEQQINSQLQYSTKQASVISRKLGYLLEDLQAFPENNSELRLALQQEHSSLSKLSTTMDVLREQLSEEQTALDDLVQADGADGLEELNELKEKVAKDVTDLERSYSQSQGILSQAAQHLPAKTLETSQPHEVVAEITAPDEVEENDNSVITNAKSTITVDEEPAAATVIAVLPPEEVETEGRELGGIPRGQINASILKEGTLEKLGRPKLIAEPENNAVAPEELHANESIVQMDEERTETDLIQAEQAEREGNDVLRPLNEENGVAKAGGPLSKEYSHTTTPSPVTTAEQIEKPDLPKSTHKRPEVIAQDDIAIPIQNQSKANWKQHRAILAERLPSEKPTPLQPTPILKETPIATAIAEQIEPSLPMITPPPAKPENLQARNIPLPPVKTASLAVLAEMKPNDSTTLTAELPPLEGIEKSNTLQENGTSLAEEKPPQEEIQRTDSLPAIGTAEEDRSVQDPPFFPPTVAEPLPIANSAPLPSSSAEPLIQTDAGGYKSSPLATIAIEHGASAFKWYVFSAVNRGLYKNPNMEFDIVEFSEDSHAQNAQEVKQILESLGVEPTRLHVKKASADDKEPRVNIYPMQ